MRALMTRVTSVTFLPLRENDVMEIDLRRVALFLAKNFFAAKLLEEARHEQGAL
jgi:hypothetical protein